MRWDVSGDVERDLRGAWGTSSHQETVGLDLVVVQVITPGARPEKHLVELQMGKEGCLFSNPCSHDSLLARHFQVLTVRSVAALAIDDATTMSMPTSKAHPTLREPRKTTKQRLRCVVEQRDAQASAVAWQELRRCGAHGPTYKATMPETRHTQM